MANPKRSDFHSVSQRRDVGQRERKPRSHRSAMFFSLSAGLEPCSVERDETTLLVAATI